MADYIRDHGLHIGKLRNRCQDLLLDGYEAGKVAQAQLAALKLLGHSLEEICKKLEFYQYPQSQPVDNVLQQIYKLATEQPPS